MPDQIAHRQRINYLLSETEAIYHEASLRLGLSDSEMKILYSIRDKKSAVKRPLKEILVFSGMAKQTANSALRKMENAGWLFLEGGQKNKTVCLTQKGVELAINTADVLIDNENSIFEGWNRRMADEYLALNEKFMRQLRLCVDNLAKKRP